MQVKKEEVEDTINDNFCIEEYESPYCEVCGHCGEIGCCGIRNFIEEHIEGKTNCKNEAYIIQDLINLCDYKDEVFKENERLHFIIKEVREYIKERRKYKGEPFYLDEIQTEIVCEILDKEGKDNEI